MSSPFVPGFLRPTVYLPLSAREFDLPLVPARERAHVAGRGRIRKMPGFLLLAVYRFSPLFRLVCALFCRDMELACDKRVCRDMDASERRACCAAGRSVFTSPLAFGEIDVRARTERVLNGRPPPSFSPPGRRCFS